MVSVYVFEGERIISCMITMTRAKTQDADKLGKLYYKCLLETYSEIMGEEKALQSFSVDKCIAEFKKTRCIDVIIGWLDNKMIGFCEYCGCKDPGALRDTGEVTKIYVLKEHQNHGEGRRLIHEAVRFLRRQEYNQAISWVEPENNNAAAFYKEMGFLPDAGVNRINPQTGLKEIIYFRNI